MKKYFIRYKPFLLFLIKFFLTFIILTVVYQVFLGRFENNKIDSITRLVAKNTVQFLDLFPADAAIEENKSGTFIKLIYNHTYVARMIEGCNAVSIIILFISFVVSFSGKLKPTLLFIFAGSVIIYVLNVIRIALLSALIYHFPSQLSLLHGVLFPLFIYGVVFILWLIWIRKFSLYATVTTVK
ncbi:exosortase family protein XrtF [Flavobacterium sp. XN-5]|uniref:exosortase family protein XrtF n=1 Tax=Flavobacterium sp. XN-5 TaxID=2599390 RepID=UPI0011CAE981|nr:exosortase family protein XrtF [Flavobacterium sp. XN-5]NGY36147.1 exosortase family protein XrtF [Flavobacterium sp. XN-5]